MSQSFLISRRAQTLIFSIRLFFIAFVYFLITAICPYLSFVLKKQFFYFKISKSFSLRKYNLNLDLNNLKIAIFFDYSYFYFIIGNTVKIASLVLIFKSCLICICVFIPTSKSLNSILGFFLFSYQILLKFFCYTLSTFCKSAPFTILH